MLTVFVKGFSKNSESEALSIAMAQASSYIKKDQDVNISVVSVGPKNDGFEAVLKVVIIPMSDGRQDKPAAQDVEYEHIKLQDYMNARQNEEDGAHDKRIREYLRRYHGNYAHEIPDINSLTLSEDEALHDIFETVFFQAAHFDHFHEIPDPEQDVPDIREILKAKARYKVDSNEPE
jgi:hypothetical protein